LKPGGAAGGLAEDTEFYYWWSKALGLKDCPKFRGTGNMKAWHLVDAANKPILYLMVYSQ